MVEFAVNNKTYLVTKVSSFIANHGREIRMEADIRKKRKVKKAMEFVEKIKRVQEKVEVVLRKAQEEIKRQVNRRIKEAKEWKKGNKVMLSMKDLVFKKRLARKLVN